MARTERQAQQAGDLIRRAVNGLEVLNWVAFFEKGLEDRRGGFSSSSMGSGRRSAEIQIPVGDQGGARDPHDRELDSEDRRYLSKCEQIDALVADLADLERGRRLVMDRETASKLAAEYVSPRASACANCGRVVERTSNDRLRAGRCFDCWRYRQRNDGAERPKDLW